MRSIQTTTPLPKKLPVYIPERNVQTREKTWSYSVPASLSPNLRQLCFVLEVFKGLSQDRVPPLVVDMIFLSLLGGDAQMMRLAVCTVGMCTSDDEDEDEEEKEDEDEDMDEICGTESRFPASFRHLRMCGNCRQGWECVFAHSVSELTPKLVVKGPDDFCWGDGFWKMSMYSAPCLVRL